MPSRSIMCWRSSIESRWISSCCGVICGGCAVNTDAANTNDQPIMRDLCTDLPPHGQFSCPLKLYNPRGGLSTLVCKRAALNRVGDRFGGHAELAHRAIPQVADILH